MLLENNTYPADTRVRKEAHSLRDAGYHVTVMAPRADDEPATEVVDGVAVERFRVRLGPPSPLAYAVEHLLATVHLHLCTIKHLRKFDVLHLHNPPDTLFPAAFLARLLGRKVVYDQHDLAPEILVERFGRGPLERLLRTFERLTYKAADAVLVVNGALREIALTRGKVRSARIFVVRNAPTAGMMNGSEPARPGSLSDLRLLYVGFLGPQDGVDDLIPLLQALHRDHGLTGAHLTVVGAGERLEPMRAAAMAAGLEDAVTFTGFLGTPAVAACLKAADICVEPARCNPHNHRCSMVKVYEYMAAGRAIVGYPLREVQLLGGEDIAYAPCNDLDGLAALVAELATDGEQRVMRAARLAERSRSQTWEREAEQLLAAYSSL